MIQDIELDEEKFVFDDSGDVHSVANVLKQCEYMINRDEDEADQIRPSGTARTSLPPPTF